MFAVHDRDRDEERAGGARVDVQDGISVSRGRGGGAQEEGGEGVLVDSFVHELAKKNEIEKKLPSRRYSGDWLISFIYSENDNVFTGLLN